MGLDSFDNRQEIKILLSRPFGVVPRKGDLCWSQFVSVRLEKQSWLIQTPAMAG